MSVFLTAFHDVRQVHTFQCPVCHRVLGEGRTGILVRDDRKICGLVGILVECCGNQIGRPETFSDLDQAELALSRYLTELERFRKAIETDSSVSPPFVLVPATHMNITPERVQHSIPSASVIQGN